MYFSVLISFFVAVSSFADCTQQPSDSWESAVAEANISTANIYQASALNNLFSLEYVKHNFDELLERGYDVCLATVPLEKNSYQYYRFYIQATLSHPLLEQTQVFHMLFQNASVQALHGNRRKPWVGLDGELAAQHLKKISHLEEVALETPAQDIREFVALLSLSGDTPKATISALKLGDSRFLVSWMNKRDGGGAFLDAYYSEALIVDIKEGVATAYEVRSLFHDLLLPMDSNLRDVQPQNPADFKGQLFDLSQGL